MIQSSSTATHSKQSSNHISGPRKAQKPLNSTPKQPLSQNNLHLNQPKHQPKHIKQPISSYLNKTMKISKNIHLLESKSSDEKVYNLDEYESGVNSVRNSVGEGMSSRKYSLLYQYQTDHFEINGEITDRSEHNHHKVTKNPYDQAREFIN